MMAVMTADGKSEARFVRESGIAGEIAGIAEPVLADLGYRLVRVVVSGRDGGTVQVMADRPDGEIDVDDCARISRELDPVLDAYAGRVRESYGLEISSPGIDRPLVRASDIERYVGHEARIELREMVDGRKRFRGTIEGFEDGEFRLETELGEGQEKVVLGFPLSSIESAKLILTDQLIELGAKKFAERNASHEAANDTAEVQGSRKDD